MRPEPLASGPASSLWVPVRCGFCNKKLCDRPRDESVSIKEIASLDVAPLRGTVTKCRCGRLFQIVSAPVAA